MQKIRINYSEYTLPENAGFSDKFLLPIAEHFELPGYKEEKEFVLEVEFPDLFLKKGEKFVAQKSLTGRNEDTQFIILNWNYKFLDEENSEIELSVKRDKPPVIESLFASLSPGWQDGLAFGTILLTVFIIFISSVSIIFYPEPLWLWEFIGKYIRGFVGWSLFGFMLLLLIWSQVKFEKSKIAQTFFGTLLGILIFLVPAIWLIVSIRPAEFVGVENGDILYLNYLQSRFSSGFMFFVGVVPWLTIFLKYFGWDLVVSLLSKIAEGRKKEAT